MILYNQFDRTVSRKPYEGTDRRSVSSLHKGGFTGTVGSNRGRFYWNRRFQ